MATAYVATLHVMNSQGQKKTYNYTASDVTGANLLLPSGEGSTVLSSQNSAIVDCIVSSGAGDTSQILIFVNGQNTGKIIYKALSLSTAIGGRMVQMNPIPIPSGALVTFQQLT